MSTPLYRNQPIDKQSELIVLQITDTHLLNASGDKMLGVDTENSMRAVLRDAARHNPDLIIATGDIAQDPIMHVYQRFAQTVAKLIPAPLLSIPGNHDLDQPMLRAGLVDRSKDVGKWSFVGIDTHFDDDVQGQFPAERRDALQQQLSQLETEHVIVFGHHPPVSLESHWLDRHQISEGARLLELLAQDGRVRAYVFGHAHQEVDLGSAVRLLGTPSSCFQFEQRCEDFTLSAEQPGYRILRLSATGEIKSEIFRLPDYELSLDLSQLQY